MLTNKYYSSSVILFLIGCFSFYHLQSQSIDRKNEPIKLISSPILSIQVNEHQTSHLIFPEAIIYFDLGDPKHYVADYTNNILRIKGQAAIDPSYHTTNLTVITKDKAYYSFYVSYTKRPQLNYFIEEKGPTKFIPSPLLENQREIDSPPIPQYEISPKNRESNQVSIVDSSADSSYLSSTFNISIQSIYRTAQSILHKTPLYNDLDIITKRLRKKHGDIEVKLKGIYHSLHYCYIYYEIKNHGAIPYDIAYSEIGIRAKKRPKKTALNEAKLPILYTLNADITRVLPYRINRYVAVLEKLAVPEERICYLEIIESGRNITLDIPYNAIHIAPIKEF